MTSPNFGCNPLGACSWSLRPESGAHLAEMLHACGLRRVQLALDPIRTGRWSLDATRRALADAGIEIASAMIAMEGEDYATLESIRVTGGVRPDATWETNLAASDACAAIARELGVSLVTFHAGFIPESGGDPLRARMIDRIAAIARLFEEHGVRVALETGQESPEALLEVLGEPRLAGVGVNLDPANMILYHSADSVRALTLLMARVVQVHLKDARSPTSPGAWGVETALGDGDVDWARFFALLCAHRPGVPLMIERESGERRVDDIRRGADLAERFGGVR